jgi:hypothetical protein
MGTHVTRRSAILMVAAAVLAWGGVTACGSAGSTGGSPPDTRYASGAAPTDPVDGDADDDGGDEAATPADSPSGEIWQWAIGRNVWTDPYLRRYSAGLGRSSRTDVNVKSEGFQLTLDGSGAVAAVTLYNDETSLGFPASSSNFEAYRGGLPGDLSWDTTPEDIDASYGDPNRSGGFGTEIRFTYQAGAGYLIEVAFTARHERDLAGSSIHSITVRRG